MIVRTKKYEFLPATGDCTTLHHRFSTLKRIRMPLLSFDIYSNYDEVIRLRREVTLLENRLKSFGPGTSVATIRTVEKQLQSARRAMIGLAQGATNAGAELEMGIRRGVGGAVQAINELQHKLSNPLAGTASILGLAGLGGLLGQISNVRAQFQQMKSNIDTLVGEKMGDKLMAQLTDFAKVSPLDFKGTVSGAQMMLGFGIDPKKVPDYLAAIGDVAMGDAQRFRSLTLAFSQMSATGKLMGQDLNQMINAGFNPLAAMAEKTGKSIVALKKEMSDGKITSEMVQQAFIDATSEGGKYYGMSEKASKTIGGQMSMLQDSLDLMFNDLGTKSEGAIIKVIHGATAIIENYEKILPVLGRVIAVFGVYKTAMMAGEFIEKKSVDKHGEILANGLEEELKKAEALKKAKEEVATATAAPQQGTFRKGARYKAKDTNALIDELLPARSSSVGADLSTKAGELASAKSELQHLESEINSKGIMLERLGNQIERQEAKVEAAKAKLVNASGANRTYVQADLDKAQADLDNSVSKRDTMVGEMNSLHSRRDTQLEQTKALSEAYDIEKKRLADIVSLEDRLGGADGSIAKERAQLSFLQEQLDRMSPEERISELGQRTQDAIDALKAELQGTLNFDSDIQEALDLGTIPQDNAEKLQLLRNELDDYIETLSDSISELDNEKDAIESGVTVLDDSTREERLNTIERERNALQTKLSAAENDRHTLSNVRNANTERLNTMQQRLNTAEQKKNGIARAFSVAWAKIQNATMSAGTSVMKMATNAWKSFTASLMANPFTFILTAATTLFSLLTSFGDEAEVASAEVERFGESAVKTMRNLETLYAVANSVDKESKVQKDALGELEKLAREYGLTLDDEADKLAQLNKLRGQLISLLQQEGEARQTANRIASYSEDKKTHHDNLETTLAEKIKKHTDATDEQAKYLARAMADDLERNADELNALYEQYKEASDEAVLRSQKGDSQGYQETYAHIQELREKIKAIASESAKRTAGAMGIDFNPLSFFDIGLGDVRDRIKTIAEINTLIKAEQDTAAKIAAAGAAIQPAKVEEKISGMSPDKLMKGVKEATDKLKAAQSTIDELNERKIDPKVDDAELAAFLGLTEETKDAIATVDNTSATPFIDSKYIDEATAKLTGLTALLRAANGQSLYATQEEADEIKRLRSKFTIRDGKYWGSKDDIDAYQSLIGKIQSRSFMKVGGRTIQVGNANQALALAQLTGKYGTDLEHAEITNERDKALYRTLSDAVRYADAKRTSETAPKKLDEYYSAYEAQIKKAKTASDFSNLRKELSSRQSTIEQKSAEWYRIERMLKQIDARDASKHKNEDPKQTQWEIDDARRKEAEAQAVKDRQNAKKEQELRIKLALTGNDKERKLAELETHEKLALLEDEAHKEAKAIEDRERQEWKKQGKQRKDWQFYAQGIARDSEKYMREARERIGYDVKRAEIEYNNSEELRKIRAKEMASMMAYLREYGTYSEKRLAIEQEYAAKKPKNEGERLANEAAMNAELQKIEIDDLKKQIDWGSIMGDFGSMLADQVQPTIDKLKAITQTDDFKKASLEEQKAVYEMISSLEKTSTKWNSNIASTLGSAVIDYQQAVLRQKEAAEKESKAADEYRKALAEQKHIEEANDKAQKEGKTEDVDKNAEQIAAQAAADALQALQEAGGDAAAAAANLANKQQALQTATSQATNMFTSIAEGLQGLASGSLSGVWGGLTKLMSPFEQNGLFGYNDDEKKDPKTLAGMLGKELLIGVQKLFGKDSAIGQSIGDALGSLGSSMLGQIVSAFFSILDILKNGIGQFVASLIDTILGAVNGLLKSILSGEFLTSILSSIVTNITSILDTITFGGFSSWLGNGDSDKNLERDIERLTASNEALRNAISNLAEKMDDARVADLPALYNDQIEYLDKAEASTLEMMQRSAAAYNNGTFGIDGKHSSNKAINEAVKDFAPDTWKKISALLGKTIRGASDFFRLSSDEMAKVANELPTYYGLIRQYAAKGYKDAAQFMDEYVSYGEQRIELLNAYREHMTSVSLDSVKSEFASMLLDMESSTEDFADSFEKMMQQAVVNSMMSSKYDDMIQGWYERFADAMKVDAEGRATIDVAEQRALQQEWDDIVNSAVGWRDQIKATMGWEGSATQQSSSRTLSGMSQDTAEAIEGRLTAIQIAVETIRAGENTQTLSITELNNELLQVMQQYSMFNVHYDNIEQQLAKMYLELLTISENTGAIVKPIQDMQLDIAQIKRNTQNL